MTIPPTYFPGFPDHSLAEPIQVRAGAELSGSEIRLRAVPVYRVQGLVLDDQGRAAAGVSVRLSALDPWDATGIEAQTGSRSDGAFEFPAVRPGDRRFAAEIER